MSPAERATLHAALEPAALPLSDYEVGATLSIAISLKRIADVLAGTAAGLCVTETLLGGRRDQ